VRSRDLDRLAILTAVVALHLLLAAGLWRYRQAERADSTPPGADLVMIIVEQRADERAQPLDAFTPRRAPLYLPAPSPITIPSPDDSEVQGRPDWDEAARLVAAKIAADPPQASAAKQPHRPSAKFGWDISKTRRWEPAPEGGTVVRLNDRCQIVFAPLPLGGCSLGKIEARGDLFDGMREALDSAERD
jgi:hypothetical protein